MSAVAEVLPEDLIVKGTVCIGPECIDEDYPFDALRIHGPNPLLYLVDKPDANDGPDHDWSMGITDGGTTGPSDFIIRDETSGVDVLRMTADGAVALGARAQIVENAVSVGAMGDERRISHVADAVDDSDVVTLGQFEGEIQAIRDRIDSLTARIETLAGEVE